MIITRLVLFIIIRCIVSLFLFNFRFVYYYWALFILIILLTIICPVKQINTETVRAIILNGCILLFFLIGVVESTNPLAKEDESIINPFFACLFCLIGCIFVSYYDSSLFVCFCYLEASMLPICFVLWTRNEYPYYLVNSSIWILFIYCIIIGCLVLFIGAIDLNRLYTILCGLVIKLITLLFYFYNKIK